MPRGLNEFYMAALRVRRISACIAEADAAITPELEALRKKHAEREAGVWNAHLDKQRARRDSVERALNTLSDLTQTRLTSADDITDDLLKRLATIGRVEDKANRAIAPATIASATAPAGPITSAALSKMQRHIVFAARYLIPGSVPGGWGNGKVRYITIGSITAAEMVRDPELSEKTARDYAFGCLSKLATLGVLTKPCAGTYVWDGDLNRAEIIMPMSLAARIAEQGAP